LSILKKPVSRLVLTLALLSGTAVAAAETLTVAAAASMKPAFTDLIADFTSTRAEDRIEAVYGASGKFATQIANGAPFGMFLSADTEFPEKLAQQGHTAGKPRVYAIGQLVLWSRKKELATLALQDLPKAAINKFAIANPATAPYGERAREALQKAGAWNALQGRLVLGENISQTAQFVDSGAAEAGLIALSLVTGPELRGKGAYSLVAVDQHAPLEQAFVLLKTGKNNPLAAAFADYLLTPRAQAIMKRYGFSAPANSVGKP
jgi:molybdate transport system substrate-binding protein